MSAHTPGPWIVTGGERLKYVEARIGNGMLQEVASCMLCEKGDLKANARLIAAAPELLAALIEANKDTQLHDEHSGRWADLIAKAGGDV